MFPKPMPVRQCRMRKRPHLLHANLLHHTFRPTIAYRSKRVYPIESSPLAGIIQTGLCSLRCISSIPMSVIKPPSNLYPGRKVSFKVEPMKTGITDKFTCTFQLHSIQTESARCKLARYAVIESYSLWYILFYIFN